MTTPLAQPLAALLLAQSRIDPMQQRSLVSAASSELATPRSAARLATDSLPQLRRSRWLEPPATLRAPFRFSAHADQRRVPPRARANSWHPSRHRRRRTRVPVISVGLVLSQAAADISGFTLENGRVADERGKRLLLGAVEGERKILPLSAALRVLRLSPARYHAWVRGAQACTLDDRPSCPRTMHP